VLKKWTGVRKQLVLSIAAGSPPRSLKNFWPKGAGLAIMPNTPALVGLGMRDGARRYAKEIHERAARHYGNGRDALSVSERHMDAVTAVSGPDRLCFYVAER